MKKQTILTTSLVLLFSLISFAQVKIGDNPATLGTSSALELESSNKAILITRIASTALIQNPVNGMLVYDVSSNCIKAYQNGVWTSRLGYDPTSDVLSQIGEEGDSPNALASNITVIQIRSIAPVILGIVTANQAGYQAYIDANPNSISAPATLTEVQNMITAVNAAFSSVLNQIGNEGDSPNTVTSIVTTLQLTSLGVTGIITANQPAYQSYIDTNPNNFSAPATLTEVQAMITAVNSDVSSVLTQIGNEGDSPNTVASVVTTVQLTSLGVTGVITDNQKGYQTYIDENPNNFSTPATLAEVQAMITSVNAAFSSVLTQIGIEEDSSNTVASSVTTAQLTSIGVTGVITVNQAAYQAYINLNSNYFSNPATLAEVQAMTTTVNSNVLSILTQIGNEGDNPNTVTSVVTTAQLNSLGMTGVITANQEEYQAYIDANPNSFATPATLTEVQNMITAVNTVALTSNGTALVNSYTCSTASAGSLTQGTSVSGVTQTITVNVGTVGTYNLTTGAINGVTFAASGTFTGRGSQTVNLIATGTPTEVTGSPYNYTLNTTPGCSFTRPVNSPTSNGTAVINSIISCSTTVSGTLTVGNPVWFVSQTITVNVGTVGTYNLTTGAINGVTFTATGTFTSIGNQTVELLASGTPIVSGSYSFSLNTSTGCSFTRPVISLTSNGTATISSISDCATSTAIGTLTAGTAVSGVKQIFTVNVTVPGTYSITTASMVNGVYFGSTGTFTNTGIQTLELVGGGTPTSATASPYSYTLYMSLSCPFTRTVTNNTTSNGTATISSITDCATSTAIGTMTLGTAVSGVKQTITVNVGTIGTYSLTTGAINGVTFAATGTFTATGSQTVDLIASGTPTLVGSNDFALTTSLSCPFTRTVTNNPTSNGTATISSITDCATSTAIGTMTLGTAVSGVKQTITVNVGTIGTYNLTTAAINGVTFAATGTFTATGSQTVDLIATGTPTAAGSNNFALTTSLSCPFTRTVTNNPTSNGTAIINSITDCATSTAIGTMTLGTAVSGVKQTITVNVGTIGTYNLTTAAINGMTFAATGTFTTTGSQTVDLIATGTPTIAGSNDFALTTSLICPFTRTVNNNATSNGSATIGSITDCATSIANGIMTVGMTVSGVSQTITVNVTTAGTYSIATTAAVNGVTFAASGTFASTGAQTVNLIASGVPTAVNTSTFTLNTTSACSFTRVTSMVCKAKVNGVFKQFMCYNLGVTGTQDPLSYQTGNNNGVLYQWGRKTDGHEVRTSATQAGPATSVAAAGIKFITNGTSPYDWITPQNNTLWGDGTSGTDPAKAANDPCPTGFKVPSSSQWSGLYKGVITTAGTPSTATQNTWTWTSNGFTVGTELFLPASGYRDQSTALVGETGTGGNYWSSSIIGSNSNYLAFNSGTVNPASYHERAIGLSVRCISETDLASNGTAVIDFTNCSSTSTGTMTAGTAVSGVKQTITVNVTTAGTYNLTTGAINGVTFAASGTFTGTGAQNVDLIATGTPTAATTSNFAINTTSCPFTRTVNGSTSNGTAIISSITDCATSTAIGTMTAGTVVSGVKQTITVNVGTIGTYNLTTAAINGVTFAATGTFATTGSQTVDLTATGTPTVAGSNNFALTTSLSCPFTRTVISPTSNGTATIGSITDCATSIANGTITVGVPVANVSQTITVNVTTVGTYSISTTTAVNGVTFAASGTFASTGAQTVNLIATGTPTATGSSTFTLNTTSVCSFSRVTSVLCGAILNGVFKQFMCYNLGVTGTQDPFTYQAGANNGTLYQWGRKTDGHEVRTSATQAGPATSVAAAGIKFITNGTSPYDWITPQNNTLWGDGTTGADPAKATNDPCPAGFKVPSQSQWSQIINENTWTWNTNAPGWTTSQSNSTLYLPAAGFRYIDGSIRNAGAEGNYWSSSVTGSNSYNIAFNSIVKNPPVINTRSLGVSVRCIADTDITSNGTALIDFTNCSSTSTGTMTAGTAVSGVKQTITVNVTTAGTYNLTTGAINGVTFAASGTFAGTGAQTVDLIATGTPTTATTSNFAINTTSCPFSRTINSANPNGTAVIDFTNCSSTSTGTMTAGTAVSGVKQTITVNVTTAGTYNLTTGAINGVTFAASGTFTGTGAQNVDLIATGTPTAATTSNFAINTTSCPFSRTINSASSNSTATIQTINSCSTTVTGTMTAGSPVSGVSQTITVNVTTAGTYSINTNTINGVTFAASGTFAATGSQTVVLIATGTPTAATASPYSYVVQAASGCTFTRTVNTTSPTGSAVINSITCTTAIVGTMTAGTAVSGVKQTITVNVTTAGTYSFSTTAPVNGVTFAASGTFTVTGSQTVDLTATGTPTTSGSSIFTLNTTPNCNFTRTINAASVTCGAYVDSVYKQFMCYNLGVTGTQDPLTYQTGNNNGALYQWGRNTDGHEVRIGTIIESGPATSVAAAGNKFITNITSPFDWLSTQNNALWGDGTIGINPAKSSNDPCPTGFKVPSRYQLSRLFRNDYTNGGPEVATQNTWEWTGNGYKIGTALYLPAAGHRAFSHGFVVEEGTTGYYWSSTVATNNTYYLRLLDGSIITSFDQVRGMGFSVRCIAE